MLGPLRRYRELIRAVRTITAVESKIEDTSPPIASRPDELIATSARSTDRGPIFSFMRARCRCS